MEGWSRVRSLQAPHLTCLRATHLLCVHAEGLSPIACEVPPCITFCAALLPASLLLLLTTSEISGLFVVASHLWSCQHLPRAPRAANPLLPAPIFGTVKLAGGPFTCRHRPTPPARAAFLHLPLGAAAVTPHRLISPSHEAARACPFPPQCASSTARSSTPHRRHDGRNLRWVGRLHQESRPPP
jgi:hypothetical protein